MSTKRIAINVFASYLQTGCSILIGLFASRWVYNALGETQYGLYAVVGSLLQFVWVMNGVLTAGSGRFFAHAIGEQNRSGAEPDLLCKWFNTAISVQTVFPLILMLLFAPIGFYAIRHFLEIPDGLRVSCVIVFLCSLVSMLSNMMLSPVHALYYAKQYIFVRNIFAIGNTLFCALEGWWLLHYDGNRLVMHGILITLLILLHNGGMAALAFRTFPEARIRFRYWFNRKRIVEMFTFSVFVVLESVGRLFGESGVAILLNKFIGPRANAAMGIGLQVFQKLQVLSESLNVATAPELITRVGAGKMTSAQNLTIRLCLLATGLGLLAVPPFIAYIGELLTLWLKTPPAYAVPVTTIMLVNFLAERLTVGYVALIRASGNMKRYSPCMGLGNASRCLFVLILLLTGMKLVPTLWLGWCLPFVLLNQARVLFARAVTGASVRQYARRVLLPMLAVSAISFGISFGFRAVFGTSLWCVPFCAALNAVAVCAFLWCFCQKEDRAFLQEKGLALVNRIRRVALSFAKHSES